MLTGSCAAENSITSSLIIGIYRSAVCHTNRLIQDINMKKIYLLLKIFVIYCFFITGVFAQTVRVTNSPRQFTVVPPNSWIQKSTTTGNSRVKFVSPAGTPYAECSVIVQEQSILTGATQQELSQRTLEAPFDVDLMATQLSSIGFKNVSVFSPGYANISSYIGKTYNYIARSGSQWMRSNTSSAATTPGLMWTVSCGAFGSSTEEAEKAYSYWKIEITKFTTYLKIL